MMAEAAAAALPALQGIPFVLNVVGFHVPAERASVMAAGIAQFEDFRFLEEKDIRDMADEFGKRTVGQGRIVFGLGRTKRMMGLMHWVQDCYRSSDVPNHEHFDEEILSEALSMAKIRKTDVDLVTANTKAAEPGKFKDERKWPEWEKAFLNYLSVVPGVSGIPLSYVVREQDEPTPGIEYATPVERMIHRAPLTGPYFAADTRRVHTLLLGFLQGENTGSWIRNIAKYQDGRRDMIALRRHYAGEGNATRRIGDAKRIQSTLHYKTERALPFTKFLDSLQRMFTIFEEESEPLSERAKVDELLSKVQSTALAAAVASLRYQLNTVGVSFTVAANHLSSELSQSADYLTARKISSISSSGGRGNGGRGGRGGRGRGGGRGGKGSSKTTYYSPSEWEKLSFEERDRIRKERDKKGEQGGIKKRNLSEYKQLTNAIISSIKKVADGKTGDDAKSDDDATPKKSNHSDNLAGFAFGGRESAKRNKHE